MLFDKLSQLRKLQKEVAKESFLGEALEGQIKVTMNGAREVKEIKIDPEILTAENAKKIEKGLLEALNAAGKEMQSGMISKVQSGELKFPEM